MAIRITSRRSVLATGAVLAALAAALVWQGSVRRAVPREPVGLFTTLPILWAESGDVGDLISSRAERHWARNILEQTGPIVPLDDLAQPDRLAPLHRIVIAQPRPLSPSENVALDRWVRGGGHLLLFADPMLTEESAFALGDPRRPQTSVLLSPILGRWGLELRYDERQPFGEHAGKALGIAVPVNLAGSFALEPGSACVLSGGGLAADCPIGKGRVLVLADAALLEQDGAGALRVEALGHLLETAFARP